MLGQGAEEELGAWARKAVASIQTGSSAGCWLDGGCEWRRRGSDVAALVGCTGTSRWVAAGSGGIPREVNVAAAGDGTRGGFLGFTQKWTRVAA